jgi:hypothetical protein
VDGVSYSSTQTFNWILGSSHSLAVSSPQSGGAGTEYVFTGWSDGGAASHNVTAPNSPVTYTANFGTQYQLTTVVSPAGSGSVTPASGQFFASGTVVSLTATANSGYTFASWSGNVVAPGNSSTTITMSAPQTVTASFNVVIVSPATVLDYRVLFGSQSYSLLASSRNRLPWQITAVQVVFSKPVLGDVNSLTGVTTTGLAGAGTATLTWAITPITLGNVATSLVTTGADALTDAGGTPVASFAASFRVLYGDFNDDGVVNSIDMVSVNNASKGVYNLFADINGDGLVNVNDVQIVRSRIGTSLP